MLTRAPLNAIGLGIAVEMAAVRVYNTIHGQETR